MPLRLLRHLGMLPEILLIERSKICILESLHKLVRMVPWNPLDVKLRTRNSVRLFPIQVGMRPERLFSPTSSSVNMVQFFKEDGNSPVRLLLRKLNI
ncbi:hypothetical protein HanIR_Chr01g0037521 [Helianthus annuus]|nr:hypothetical protein HanIR_Chr01g0037521 [Helianthus annuus]